MTNLGRIAEIFHEAGIKSFDVIVCLSQEQADAVHDQLEEVASVKMDEVDEDEFELEIAVNEEGETFEEKAQRETAERLLKDGWTVTETEGEITRVAPPNHPRGPGWETEKVPGVIWERMK